MCLLFFAGVIGDFPAGLEAIDAADVLDDVQSVAVRQVGVGHVTIRLTRKKPSRRLVPQHIRSYLRVTGLHRSCGCQSNYHL